MPTTVSVLSKQRLDAVRLTREDCLRAVDPVYVETRQASGYFDALKLKEVIDDRPDLQYMRQTNRNMDRDGIPGFSFLLDGDQNLSDFFKQTIAGRDAKAAPAAAETSPAAASAD